MSWTLAVSGSLGLAAGAGFLATSAWFARGHREGLDAEARAAARSFTWWWAALGVFTLLQAILDLVAATGAAPLDFFVATRLVSIVVLGFALYGLLDYTLYLRWGNARHRLLAAAYFLVASLGSILAIVLHPPTHVEIAPWRADVGFQRAMRPWESGFLVVVWTLPQFAACASQLLLSRDRAAAGPARDRMRTVFGALLVYVVANAIARYTNDDALHLLLRPVLGLAIAIVVVRAYAPRAPPRASTPAELALETRIRELV